MTKDSQPPPIPPYKSSEFLDYVMKFNGEQVDAYKRLLGGIARSSCTIAYHADDETFTMFVDIIGDFAKMNRSEFLAFHGDCGCIWHICPSPVPKPENERSTLIAICEESPDVPAELRRILTGRRVKSRCAKCRKPLPCLNNPAQIIRLCDKCRLEYVEGSEFYGILYGCGGSDPMCSAGSRSALAEAMEYVRGLDRLGYECRLYKGNKPCNDAVELRLWIPLMRIFPAESAPIHDPAETPN